MVTSCSAARVARRWAVILAVAAFGAGAGCGEGDDDDGPFIFDPTEAEFLADAVIYRGATAVESGPITPTRGPAQPRLEIAGLPPGATSSLTGTATTVSFAFGTVRTLEWTFRVPDDSPGEFDALLVRVVGRPDYAIFAKTLTSSATFTHAVLVQNVGVGSFELEFHARALAPLLDDSPGRAPLYSAPLVQRVTVNAQGGLELEAVPSAYDPLLARCAGDPNPNPGLEIFAHAVSSGRCFFLVNLSREDCVRCDDVGVDLCAQRFCQN